MGGQLRRELRCSVSGHADLLPAGGDGVPGPGVELAEAVKRDEQLPVLSEPRFRSVAGFFEAWMPYGFWFIRKPVLGMRLGFGSFFLRAVRIREVYANLI